MTLGELLISSTLLLFCFSAVFILFNRGQDALKRVSDAGGLQSSLLQMKLVLQGDFQRTTLSSVTVLPAPTLEQRDSLSCLILDDWSDPNNFSPKYSAPLWNQRVSYVNGLEGEGNLDRFVLTPDDPDHLLARPLPTIWPLNVDDTVVGQRRIASNVSKFTLTFSPDLDFLEIHTSLKQGRGKSVTGEFVFAPRHTKDYI